MVDAILIHPPHTEQFPVRSFFWCVLIADLDEMFLPNPVRFRDLFEYVSKSNEYLIALVAYEIMPESTLINWSQPILTQRSKYARLCGLDKPVLTRIPWQYTFGTHVTSQHSAFTCGNSKHSDQNLYNIHLKCADVSIWNENMRDSGRSLNNISEYIRLRCYRKQLAVYDIPFEIRVF